jgi:hypothetical protein
MRSPLFVRIGMPSPSTSVNKSSSTVKRPNSQFLRSPDAPEGSRVVTAIILSGRVIYFIQPQCGETFCPALADSSDSMPLIGPRSKRNASASITYPFNTEPSRFRYRRAYDEILPIHIVA